VGCLVSESSAIPLNAIKTIREIWQVDSNGVLEWVGDTAADTILKFGYGFDWWPGDFKVEVRVSGPHPEIEEPVYRLSVRTNFLRDVDVTTPKFASTLSDLNRFVSGAAICAFPKSMLEPVREHGLDLKSSDVWLSSTAYLHEATEAWLPQLFARWTILQPIEAQFRAHYSGTVLGGTKHCSRPLQGAPSIVDELSGVEETYAEQGQQASPWMEPDEFQHIVDLWGRTEITTGLADERGLFIEKLFGNDTALATLSVDSPHPRLGHGLLARLTVPLFADCETTEAVCVDLNWTEDRLWSRAAIPLLGSWCAERVQNTDGSANRFAPSFGLFLPRIICQPGIALYVAACLLNRAQWVRDAWMPDVVDGSLEEILARRLASMKGPLSGA
jgi:hypothetical protein